MLRRIRSSENGLSNRRTVTMPPCGGGLSPRARRSAGRRPPRRPRSPRPTRFLPDNRGDSSRMDTCAARGSSRSEEHTSELQSRPHLVCRLLLEKQKNTRKHLVPIKNKKPPTKHQ